MKTINFLTRTVSQRVENIESDIFSQLKTRQMILSGFLTNARRLLLIKEVSDEFEMTEELPSMTNLCEINIGENIFKEAEKN